MDPVLPRLGIGVQEFEEVRRKGMVYVDKTGHFPGLELMGKTVFLARPRRFGKSLTVSDLAAFYSGRTELFEGLSAHGHMVSGSFEPKPVIRFDMSSVSGSKTVDILEGKIRDRLTENAESLGVGCKGGDSAAAFYNLLRNTNKKYTRRAVVLIDEYDAPNNMIVQKKKESRNEALLNDTREIMSTFYTQIKSASEHVDFTFITGVTKFSRTGVFTQLNNVTDISLEEDFAAIAGFTQEEIESYFQPHLASVADKLGITYEELLSSVREYYDGFSFDGTTRLYNPFSFVQFLKIGKFDNFWMGSGSSSVVRNILLENIADPDVYSGIEIPRSFAKDPGEIDSTPPEGFLYQAGYLSLRKVPDGFLLDYPNTEVRASFYQLFIDNLLVSSASTGKTIKALRKALFAGIATEVVECVYRYFASICYDDITAVERGAAGGKASESFAESVLKRLREHFYRAVLKASLQGAGMDVLAETHASLGRSDLVVRQATRAFVFEMKVAENSAAARAEAEGGVRQMLERAYGDSYRDPILISLAVDMERRNIGHCIILDKGSRTCLEPGGPGTLVAAGPEGAREPGAGQ
jgi:hypothetical protein